MAEIPASVGNPYIIETSGQVIKLRRTVGGREVWVLFSPADAVAVADALVDLAEANN